MGQKNDASGGLGQVNTQKTGWPPTGVAPQRFGAYCEFMRKMAMSMLLTVLGAGFAAWGWMLLADARDTLEWPAVPGLILQSSIVEHEGRTGEDTQYSVQIRYRYEVNGTQLTSDRFSLADHSSSRRAEMQAITEHFPAGSMAPVYYDPEAPASTLLRPGPTPIMWIPFVFGIFSSYAGIAAVLACSRRRKRANAATRPSAS